MFEMFYGFKVKKDPYGKLSSPRGLIIAYMPINVRKYYLS